MALPTPQSEREIVLEFFDGNESLADAYMQEIQRTRQTNITQEYMNLSMSFIKPKYLNNYLIRNDENSRSLPTTTTTTTTTTVIENSPIPGKSLDKSINSFLNVNSKESIVDFTSAPVSGTLQTEQVIFTASEKTQVCQIFASSVQSFATPIPALTGNETNPNYPTIQFLLYDETNTRIGIVGTYPLIGKKSFLNPSSSYTLQYYTANFFNNTTSTNIYNSNEPYIFLQKGQTLKFRISPLTGNTNIYNNMNLKIVLNNRVFGDELDIKSYYKLLGPSDASVGIPTFLYKNTSGKTAIVLTGSQCGSGNIEPFVCPQQDNGPSADTRFSFFYSFDYDDSLSSSPRFNQYQKLTATTVNAEGYASMIFDTRGVNCNNPYNSFRLTSNDGISVAYDSNSTFSVANGGIPILLSVFILEI